MTKGWAIRSGLPGLTGGGKLCTNRGLCRNEQQPSLKDARAMGEIARAAHVLWDFHSAPACNPPFEQIDAIIGLGSYDETIVDHCVRLWRDHRSACLIFTGKHGNWTTGRYQTTEAEHFAGLALSLGVAREKIIVEPEATNISQNIIFSEGILPDAIDSVVYVTKPQTLTRLSATLGKVSRCKRLRLSAPQRTFREAAELFGEEQIISEMVGDIDRLISYPARGFSSQVMLSDAVLAAWEELKTAGFTAHLLK